MSLFQLGDFTMHSGDMGRWKIECDALTNGDIECLAFMLAERVVPFDAVVGVPRGGLRLANALLAHRTLGARRTLIVDDVLTTGASMEEAYAAATRDSLRIKGAVIFARGTVPEWITSLFVLGDTRQEPGADG